MIVFCRLRWQSRKSTSANGGLAQLVGQALPPANRPASDQELAGESACPTFFMKFRGPKAHPNRLQKTMACPTL
jgi:hypothetical protein